MIPRSSSAEKLNIVHTVKFNDLRGSIKTPVTVSLLSIAPTILSIKSLLAVVTDLPALSPCSANHINYCVQDIPQTSHTFPVQKF